MVAARRIRAEIAASMRGEDFQTSEAVERAFEDQMLQGNGGVERIADGVREPPVAFKALRKFRRALRMARHRAVRPFPKRDGIWDLKNPLPARFRRSRPPASP